MNLTKHTDYAFRSLMYMGSMPAELATIAQIAATYDIPKSHLMKVIQKLVQAGYVESVRGKTGGIKLARPAEEINLKDIVVLMENTLKPLDCVGQRCKLLPGCKLKVTLNDAVNAFLNTLAPFHLSDVLDDKVVEILHPFVSIQVHPQS